MWDDIVEAVLDLAMEVIEFVLHRKKKKAEDDENEKPDEG